MFFLVHQFQEQGRHQVFKFLIFGEEICKLQNQLGLIANFNVQSLAITIERKFQDYLDTLSTIIMPGPLPYLLCKMQIPNVVGILYLLMAVNIYILHLPVRL